MHIFGYKYQLYLCEFNFKKSFKGVPSFDWAYKMQTTVIGLFLFHYFISMNGMPILELNKPTLEDNVDHNMFFVEESDEYHLSQNYKNQQKRENIDTRILTQAN